MRILITGASGMLGTALLRILSKEHQVFGTGSSEIESSDHPYFQFDLAENDYQDLFEWASPELIIHCAALTNGNYCANHPEEAFSINGFSMKRILDATKESVPVIYISSDAVFPSTSHMSKEEDCINPESVYGKSKEFAEFYLMNSDRNHIIIRTTIVGYHKNSKKNSFAEWIINSSINNEQISLFDDVLFTPISIWQLGEEILYLISSGINHQKVYHISGSESCTKYEFGIRLLESIGLSKDKVDRGSILSFIGRNKRATDQSLDCTAYQKEYQRDLPNIAEVVQQIKEKYYESNSTGI